MRGGAAGARSGNNPSSGLRPPSPAGGEGADHRALEKAEGGVIALPRSNQPPSLSFYFLQFVTGLASACSLFLVASGLSIIFGVTRIVNFAHGAFYMLGAYIAYSSIAGLGPTIGFWPAALVACLVVAALGALVEMTVLRRIYDAPELFQLLATFGVTLAVEDLVLIIWGPSELLGPRAPGLAGAVDLFGHPFPTYDLMLIALAPIVLGALWYLFRRTRWGVLVRAATLDREMAAALGVNQQWLFTSVFALGAFLAAMGGALALPREAASHSMDLSVIAEALVVVVIGGLGSVPGTFLAAMLVSELNAFGILALPGISLVLAFAVMAIVLVVRPTGLMGAKEAPARPPALELPYWRPWRARERLAALGALAVIAAAPLFVGNYWLGVASDVVIFALYAASLHFLVGGGGLVSFGHAPISGSARMARRWRCRRSASPWAPRWRAGWRRASPARCCSAGSACATPASIRRC